MTLEECYAKLGGDYKSVLTRMMEDTLVEKFMLRFLSDTSYDTLISALDEGNYEEAFRAAHTIKGVCQNLGFDKLFASANPLTESLRSMTSAPPKELVEEVKRDYAETINAIKEYKAQLEG